MVTSGLDPWAKRVGVASRARTVVITSKAKEGRLTAGKGTELVPVVPALDGYALRYIPTLFVNFCVCVCVCVCACVCVCVCVCVCHTPLYN
jgi:hypothetical protein